MRVVHPNILFSLDMKLKKGLSVIHACVVYTPFYSIPLDKTFLLVPGSRSSVKFKVKYQGHSFQKNGCCRGIGVSQTHLVFHVHYLLLTVVQPFTKQQHFRLVQIESICRRQAKCG